MVESSKLVTFEREFGNIRSSYDYFHRFGIGKENRILDIGCNYGSLIYNLYEAGYQDVTGVDVDAAAVEEGKAKYVDIADRLLPYDGLELPFEDERFDVVVMFDVIEHIPAIDDFLREQACRVLRPGGLFIFQTPNKYINIPWEVINHRSFTRYKEFHCSLQTYNSLPKLLENAGFDHVHIEKYNILTEHNKNKVTRKIGAWAVPILNVLSALPLRMFPNFWGICRKKK